jgi:subtilisin family serine protease
VTRLLSIGAIAAVAAIAGASPVFAAPLEIRAQGAPPLKTPTADFERLRHAESLVVATSLDPRAARLMEQAGAERLSKLVGLWRLRGNTSVLTSLRSSGLLRYAHEDAQLPDLFAAAPFTPLDPPSDPLGSTQWWLTTIGAAALTVPGPGVALAVLDTGLDASHPEFAGRAVTYLNAQALDHPHGTQVSSVAAAPVNGQGIVGVYPQVALRAADVNTLSCSDVVRALLLAVDSPAPSVLNMSWGSTDPRSCPVLYDAVIVALGVGHVPVAAAGNLREQGSPPSYPAAFPHVLTVAATDQFDSVAPFSSRDPGIDIAAPGVSVVAATPTIFDPTGYHEVAGTSFSAPMVAAAAAWAWTARPTLRPTQVIDLIRYSARDAGASGWDPDTGFGILNVPTALSAATPALDPQEPNDDIDQVKAGRLFRNSTPAITSRTRGRAAFRAWVDEIEDPVDVYRVWIPGRSRVTATITPNDNVDLEFFRPNARTVYYQNRRAALRGALIGGSYRSGKRTDRFSVVNQARRGAFIFLETFKARGTFLDARYKLTVKTSRLRR